MGLPEFLGVKQALGVGGFCRNLFGGHGPWYN
jgi:hypothetical protein